MLKLLALLLRTSRRIALLSLLAGFLSGMSSAALVALINTLLNLPTACIQLAALVIGLVYLGWLSWTLLLAGVVFVGLGMVSYQALVRRALSSLKQAREKQDAMFHHFRALTEGAKELKLHR